MRVCVDPIPATLSQAMYRVANALARYAPADVEIITTPEDADLQVLHVIGQNAERHLSAPEYAVIQYCFGSAGCKGMSRDRDAIADSFVELWTEARAVWSYYDLSDCVPTSTPFYLAPLGVDSSFVEPRERTDRDYDVLTSGYVSGPGAEAIEEVAIAAERLGLRVAHLGPKRVVGMERYPESWGAVSDLTDGQLAHLYGRCKWVSGLRHVEGFELPAVEGLARGARPIVFDRPDMRRWYEGHAKFVPDTSGDDLVSDLVSVLSEPPDPVTDDERARVLERFDWTHIASGFWAAIRSQRREVAA